MTTISSVKVDIAAPAPFVWDILVDYPHYPQWNPYTVEVHTTLTINSPIDLTLPSPTGDGTTFVNREFIRVVDPPHHLRYDTGDAIPGIFAVRDQWIEAQTPDRCTYWTTDKFTGKHAPWVIKTNGTWVKTGFDAVAHALKARAEQLWNAAA